MSNFLDFDDEKKTIKSINLDDFSIEDLEEYIFNLKLEIKRVELEIKNKKKPEQIAQALYF